MTNDEVFELVMSLTAGHHSVEEIADLLRRAVLK